MAWSNGSNRWIQVDPNPSLSKTPWLTLSNSPVSTTIGSIASWYANTTLSCSKATFFKQGDIANFIARCTSFLPAMVLLERNMNMRNMTAVDLCDETTFWKVWNLHSIVSSYPIIASTTNYDCQEARFDLVAWNYGKRRSDTMSTQSCLFAAALFLKLQRFSYVWMRHRGLS